MSSSDDRARATSGHEARTTSGVLVVHAFPPTLAVMVREIRTLRPQVVINGWGGVRGGHGNHQASAILTSKAVEAAADANQFPELANESLSPWRVTLLLEPDRSGANPSSSSELIWAVPVDDVSPLWGMSYREMGLAAFANHRSQGITGFLNSPFLRQQVRIKAANGQPFDRALLAKPITTALESEGKGEGERIFVFDADGFGG